MLRRKRGGKVKHHLTIVLIEPMMGALSRSMMAKKPRNGALQTAAQRRRP